MRHNSAGKRKGLAAMGILMDVLLGITGAAGLIAIAGFAALFWAEWHASQFHSDD